MRLKNKVIALLVADGVEDLEFYVPYMRIQEEGGIPIGAAVELKTLHGKNGLPISPDKTIESLKAEDLSGIILPGGWAPDKLRRFEVVKNIVREMDKAGKVIGIICHGGSTAISAGIVRKDESVTGSTGIKDDLVNAGGTWVDEPAFRDGNHVWGRVVSDIPDFCRELIKALEG
jgi:protease I